MGHDKSVMLMGNIILFVATAFSFYLYQQSLQSKNVQASFRMIYGGMFAQDDDLFIYRTYLHYDRAEKCEQGRNIWMHVFIFSVYIC